MHERPTGGIDSPPPSKESHLPKGFDPFAYSGTSLPYTPNRYSVAVRILSALLAIWLPIYGTLGVLIDDFYIPGKRGPGVHFHGLSVWLMYGAILSAASVFAALVIDHYDRRNNEHHYRRFKKLATWVGWSLFGLANFWQVASHGLHG